MSGFIDFKLDKKIREQRISVVNNWFSMQRGKYSGNLVFISRTYKDNKQSSCLYTVRFVSLT